MDNIVAGRRDERKRQKTIRSQTFRPAVETLDERIMLDATRWVNPAGGDWSVASNWSTGRPPGATDDVLIERPDITVTHSAHSDTVKSLTSKANLDITGGKLEVTNLIVTTGNVHVGNGQLLGHTFTLRDHTVSCYSDGLWKPISGNNLSSLVSAGGDLFAVADHTVFQFTGGLWKPISGNNLNSLVSAGGDLFAEADHTVYRYFDRLWRPVSGNNLGSLVAAGGDLFAVADHTVYRYFDRLWRPISGNNLGSLVSADGDLFAVADHTVYRYFDRVWRPVSGNNLSSLVAAGGDLFAVADHTVYRYSDNLWRPVSGNNVWAVGSDGEQLVILNDDRTLYRRLEYRWTSPGIVTSPVILTSWWADNLNQLQQDGSKILLDLGDLAQTVVEIETTANNLIGTVELTVAGDIPPWLGAAIIGVDVALIDKFYSQFKDDWNRLKSDVGDFVSHVKDTWNHLKDDAGNVWHHIVHFHL